MLKKEKVKRSTLPTTNFYIYAAGLNCVFLKKMKNITILFETLTFKRISFSMWFTQVLVNV